MDLPAGVSEEAALKYLSTDIDAELAHILQEAGVPLGLQYRLTQSFRTVRRFQSYEDNRAGIREALKTDFSLEPNTLEKLAGISAVISAWEACQQFAAKEQELRAEARVLGVARPVTQTDRSVMRAAYEATHGKLEEIHEPSEDYISCKMEELEAHEPSASPLSEVTSRKTAKMQGIQTAVDSSGHVRIVRTKVKGSFPQGTEELRTVLRVECNLWCFLATKYRNREFLRGMDPECWNQYVAFLLSDKVYLMKVPVAGGKGQQAEHVPLRPPWSVLLNFEYELRREAIKRAVQGNKPLKDTIIEVTRDAQLKEQFFTSPIALQQVGPPPRPDPSWGQRRFRQWDTDWTETPSKWHRTGKGRGNSKGKHGKGVKGGRDDNKGESKGGAKGKSDHALWTHTPDGRQICFPFNAQGCDGSCGRVHVCRVRGCMQPHPMWQHFQNLATKAAPAGATATN
eukprot:s9822_g3.t1